ncbi:hypothetical protein DFH08DRAFT_976161 [Mycena albidolilacea]|uniref:Uncharacterized protein n=1 Tax=Mycena albidolilacea TaxID=1033008 RepID=A0AAD6Z3K2_9AGAR|nr:hypothetical protein DFH08DRAFT_976161 [Mycena albidolilacea]
MLISLRTRSDSWSLDPRIYSRVILGLIIPGSGLTTALLVVVGYAAWNIVSRRYLDRVSFRLLTYALVAHLIFGVSFAMATLARHPDWRCSLLSFVTNSKFVLQQFSMMFSSCIFCMALNVPGRVQYQRPRDGKYYIAGTTLICLIFTVPPYASGNLGWDAVSQTCWYNSPNTEVRFRWVIGRQSSPIIIAAAGEVSAFLIIIHLLCRPPHTEGTYSSEGPGSTILKFRNIILRIGLYPLISCLLNITTTGIDLYKSRKYKMEAFGMTKCDNILILAGIAKCAGRPLMYGLLTPTDPYEWGNHEFIDVHV